MSTVVTVGGTPLNVPREAVAGRLVSYAKGGAESATFSVRGATLAALPDPYLGKPITITIGGTLRFTGQVESRHEEYVDGLGWVDTYQCVGLRTLGDWVRHTDANNGSDQSIYNALRDSDPLNWNATRAGRTVGQILTDVLTMPLNAQGLNGYGVGQYTGLPSAPALPAATVADLATLTFIPPASVNVGGDKLLSALEATLAQWAPWYVLRVKPDGTLRFLDLRAFTGHTLTLNLDPIEAPPLSRDLSAAASHVTVFGADVAEMFLFSVSQNAISSTFGLSEAPFAHNGLTVAQAKAAWTPANWRSPGLVVGAAGDDQGTASCTSTTTVVCTSQNAAMTWVSNYWDQTSTGHLGTVYLAWSAGTDVTTYAQRLIVSCTALTAGDTSTLTLDRALPHTNFDHYVITGQVGGATAVYTVYQLPSWAAARVAPQSQYPFAYRNAANASATLTSTAIGSVLWSSSGNPPYSSVSLGVQVDVSTGFVHFPAPTFLTAGGRPPSDVRALVPIYTGPNRVECPADVGGVTQYAGRLATVEGLHRVLPVYVPSWRDPANAANMQAWGNELLTSVQDPPEEGEVVYLGLYDTALEMGVSLSIAGDGFTTGRESAATPVVECQLDWLTGPGSATSWRTTMKVSSRKAHFSAEAFLRPDRTGVTFDWSGSFSMAGMGGLVPDFNAALGGVSVADLPTAAGSVPNPAALVDTSGGAFPNPGDAFLPAAMTPQAPAGGDDDGG